METKKERYGLIDSIRGFAIINMIIYHALWDMVNIFNADIFGYNSAARYIWRQSVCWCFIFLSGFCQRMSKNNLKRGLIVFLGGIIITICTSFFMPSSKIVFGVLTFIGSAMIIVTISHKYLKKINNAVGFAVSMLIFLILRNISNGYLGFESFNICRLPNILYNGIVMTYFGFTDKNFHSSDYFPLFPWLFLFVSGYFFNGIAMKSEKAKAIMKITIKPFAAVGRRSFIIYMLHQPVIYFILNLFYALI